MMNFKKTKKLLCMKRRRRYTQLDSEIMLQQTTFTHRSMINFDIQKNLIYSSRNIRFGTLCVDKSSILKMFQFIKHIVCVVFSSSSVLSFKVVVQSSLCQDIKNECVILQVKIFGSRS